MSKKRHVVDLTERQELETFTSKGEHRAEDITKVQILLKADEGITDETICEYLGCSISTPYRTRKR